MKRFALSAFLLSVPVVAQQPAAYKLVIVVGAGGTTVVDYPSAARCQRAADALEAEWRRQYEIAKAEPRQPNVYLTGPAFTAFAFCIPG
ncbi:hypothetical protein [Sphingomonas sp.]|uniref:hypothetical protein n=1 Tax=Sphingomonas sp. TaxID=28214 RepID=UPI003B0086FA